MKTLTVVSPRGGPKTPMDIGSRRVLLGAVASGWKPSGTACRDEEQASFQRGSVCVF